MGGRYDNFCQQVAGIGIVTINTATSPLSHPKVVVAIYRHSIRGAGALGYIYGYAIVQYVTGAIVIPETYDLTGRCVVVIHVFPLEIVTFVNLVSTVPSAHTQ